MTFKRGNNHRDIIEQVCEALQDIERDILWEYRGRLFSEENKALCVIRCRYNLTWDELRSVASMM